MTDELAEIEKLMPHHERAWKIKRAAWAGMALLVVGGMAGFLGPGPFSEVERKENEATLRYQRIARYKAPQTFDLTTPPDDSAVEISLPNSLLDKIALERIEPEPSASTLQGDAVIYTFERRGSETPGRIRFSFRPETFGFVASQIRVRGAASFDCRLLFLP